MTQRRRAHEIEAFDRDAVKLCLSRFRVSGSRTAAVEVTATALAVQMGGKSAADNWFS